MVKFLAMQVRMGKIILDRVPEIYRNSVAELLEEGA